jgi:hypothetical protein
MRVKQPALYNTLKAAQQKKTLHPKAPIKVLLLHMPVVRTLCNGMTTQGQSFQANWGMLFVYIQLIVTLAQSTDNFHSSYVKLTIILHIAATILSHKQLLPHLHWSKDSEECLRKRYLALFWPFLRKFVLLSIYLKNSHSEL